MGSRLIVGSALLALVIPATLSVFVNRALHRRVEPALSAAFGQEVRIRSAEVGLTGTLRLTSVTVGPSLAADAVEAAIGLSRLGRGELGADEITVVRPRLSATLLRDGTLDLGVRTPHARPRATRAREGGLKRIIVEGGDLLLVLPDGGEVRARDIELVPEELGVRVVTGKIDGHLRAGELGIDAGFARAGLDVSLPRLHIERAALDGGHLALTSPGHPTLALEQVILLRAAGDDVKITGHLAGSRTAAQVAVSLVQTPATSTLSADVDELPLAPFAVLLPTGVGSAGSLSGHVDARYDRDAETLDVAMRGHVDGVEVFHPVLAPVPLPLSLTVDGKASWSRKARSGRLDARLGVGAAALTVGATLALGEDGAPASVTLDAQLAKVACADVLAALPAPLRAPLDGLDLSGSVRGRLDVAVDRAHPDAAKLAVDLEVGCAVLHDAAVARVADLDGAYVHTLPDGTQRTLAATDPHFVALADLPDLVPTAFLAAEDSEFYRHRGFDIEQLRRSLAVDVSAGRVERGGSTISQQLIKNLYLTRDRTLARKLLEAVLTWRLETRIKKHRILEAYLNIVELGIGVYGIEPAAHRWFDKPPARLTAAEAAFLAALTSSPTTSERHLRERRVVDPALLDKADIVLRGMRLGKSGYEAAHAELMALDLRLDP